MDQVHSTTEQHVKGKHLTYDERMIIQIRHKEGCSPNRIAAEIGCTPNTVRNELRRGTIDLYNGHVQRYKAKQGQQAYEQNRSNCCSHYDRLAKNRFIAYVDRHVREDGWSLDVCQGRALQSGEFTREEVTCTKTLYNYVNLGLTETRNGIIRRFIPKGKRIDSYTAEEISNIEVWCNSLPRKILGYRTSDEVIEAELDRIYRAA